MTKATVKAIIKQLYPGAEIRYSGNERKMFVSGAGYLVLSKHLSPDRFLISCESYVIV